MKAAVTTKPGSPEVIELLEKSIPSVKKGQQVAAIMGGMGRDFEPL